MLRRNILRSLLFAAPAIVAAPTLMRISAKILLPSVEDVALMVSGIEQLSLNDIITTTLRNQSDKLAAQITANNAILQSMQSIQRYDMIKRNMQPIAYAKMIGMPIG